MPKIIYIFLDRKELNMGRRKIQIKRIQDDRLRQVTCQLTNLLGHTYQKKEGTDKKGNGTLSFDWC